MDIDREFYFEVDVSICNAVMHELLAYEKRQGKKPAMIVFVDKGFRDQFFSEIYEFIIKTNGVDFKEPGKFYGVPFCFKNITMYGGSCNWMIIGEL